LQTTLSTGQTLSTTSTVAFAVGIAGTIVGTILVLSSRSSQKTSAGFLVVPGGGGVSASVEF
jgi:hypothetical protein